MRNSQGDVVESVRRLDTMAEYYSEVQWGLPQHIPPSTHSPHASTGLDINVGLFEVSELTRVVKRMQAGLACGPDAIPCEFWKALLRDEAGAGHFLDLCNQCWISKALPSRWRTASVV